MFLDVLDDQQRDLPNDEVNMMEDNTESMEDDEVDDSGINYTCVHYRSHFKIFFIKRILLVGQTAWWPEQCFGCTWTKKWQHSVSIENSSGK